MLSPPLANRYSHSDGPNSPPYLGPSRSSLAGGPLPSSLPNSLSFPSNFLPRYESFDTSTSSTHDGSSAHSPDELSYMPMESTTPSGTSVHLSETPHSHGQTSSTGNSHLSSSMSIRQPLPFQTMDRPRDPFASNSSPSVNGPTHSESTPYFRASGEYQHVPSGFTPLQGGHAHLPGDDTRSPISQLTNLASPQSGMKRLGGELEDPRGQAATLRRPASFPVLGGITGGGTNFPPLTAGGRNPMSPRVNAIHRPSMPNRRPPSGLPFHSGDSNSGGMSSAFGSAGPRPAESSLRQHRSNLSVSSAGQYAPDSESYDEQHAGSSAGGSNFTFSVPHAAGASYAGYPGSQGAPQSGSDTSRRSSSIYMEDNKDFIARTPTANQHPLPGTYPKMAASPISHTRGLGIDSMVPGSVGAPRQSPPAATPQLIRATQVSTGSTPIPQGGPSSYTQSSIPNESPSPTGRAQLELHGNLAEMAKGWSHSEWRQGRRLVQFWRKQEGTTIHATFRPIDIADYVQRSIVINCIFREDKNECFVTSVDTIYLLESLVASQFTIEEKNRIRRNLEGFRPITISKSKKESEAFFKRIMSFGNPKPRNIEKDVKVFPWKVLAEALKKIIGKYSANPEPMLAPSMPYAPMGYIDDAGTGGGALTTTSGSFHHARDDSMNSNVSRSSYYYTSGSGQESGFATTSDGSFSGPSHPHLPGQSHGGALVGAETGSSPFGSFSAHHHAHSFPGTSMPAQHLSSGHLPPPAMAPFGGHYQSQSGSMGSVDSSGVAGGHSSEFLPPFGSHGSVQRQSSDSHGHAAGPYSHSHGSSSYNSGSGTVPESGSTGLYMPPSSDSFSTGFGR